MSSTTTFAGSETLLTPQESAWLSLQVAEVLDAIDRMVVPQLRSLEPLADTLQQREGGAWFERDLQEARALAAMDPRFAPLVEGLQAPTLGERLRAVDRFFASLPPAELAGLALPPSLAQLRTIFLSSLPT